MVIILLVRILIFSNIAFLTNAVSGKLATLCQSFKVRLYPLKDSGVSPVSLYTARLGQDFDTPSTKFSMSMFQKIQLLLLNPCIFLSVKTDQFSTLFKSMDDI